MSGMEPPSDGAIQQLIDLGINRQQAKNALSKYNNDVVRAADYIFSGFAREDDEVCLKPRCPTTYYGGFSIIPSLLIFKPPPLLDQSPPNQNSWTWSETPIDPGYTDTPGAWREGQWTNTDTSGTWEERPKDNGWLLYIEVALVWGFKNRHDHRNTKDTKGKGLYPHRMLISVNSSILPLEAVVLVNDSPVVDSSNPKQANNYPQELQRALDASVGDRERADIEKATAESLAHSRPAELTVAKSSHYNADQWALVTVNKDENDLNLNRAIEASYAATYTSTSMSLTWWSDPDDPRSRSRVPGLYVAFVSSQHFCSVQVLNHIPRTSLYTRPTALRPSDSAYQFTPSIIQALYHVPVFREAVLAYRPSLESWGYTDEYWRGMGSNLPEMQLMQVTEDKEMQPRYTTMTKPLPSAAKCKLGGGWVGEI
ncbi:hypothetical protein BC937DRAFT_93012 [Endogone sp. FLAS-F59071]|nr:hypothetical protein BC937DRAFT_93012 [Endogone sp. FLAS-F59071]|eukprot:RUS23057.1 hypothetical protein BC937DRAFT_93012 [Endogone sp. FLAS-F59071]